ncbi:MAG: hypothetical protein IKW80_03550 [Thermoguttaceae bacterium]|nr:hypothetical protein [Thermoguttaceae bacterium]
MASPFKFFRKHQTELLVVIGLLTMVAFIILPSILQQLEVIGRSRTTANVVETKKYGALSTFDVQRLKERQHVLMGFFNRLVQAYQGKLNELYQNRDQDKMTELYKVYMNSMKAQQLAAQVGDSADQTVVLMWLLENKAREMGLTINDSMISSFISENTDGLDESTINLLIYGDETQKNASAENSLFNALNGYLLREKVVEVLGASWSVSTTGEKLDSFCRMNQRANVEFFPVKVEDFIEKVADPSDAEVISFFDKYKDKDANITSSEPGLRQPQKIALEYCFGSYAQFMDPTSITDEQVQKNYEENKENYVIEKKDDEKQENKLGEMPNIGLTDPNAKQYRPLDDTLKEEIRQSLARVAAMEKLRNAVGVVQKSMNDYSVAKDTYEMKFTESDRKREDVQKQAPAKVDFTTLAKDNKLEYVSTGLMTQHTFMDSPLAELRLEDVAGSVDAASEFFGKTPLLQSKVFTDSEGKLYVIWKSEDVEEHTPTLDEEGVKQQTVDQIKYREARKLAAEEAKKLADKAVKEQLPLKSCLGDAAFVPPQFTWMTFGPVINPNMQRRVYLSPIEGVQDAGFDFMKTLFQMKDGEISSIVNSSESVYYVVRMIELTPTEQLYARFLVTPDYEYAQARTPDGQYFYSDLREKLEKDAGLKWVVRPKNEVDFD